MHRVIEPPTKAPATPAPKVQTYRFFVENSLVPGTYVDVQAASKEQAEELLREWLTVGIEYRK